MSILISCENLEKTIGNRTLFQGVCFNVHEKERIGLIGPNGSGKSTLMKMLSGFADSDTGGIIKRKGLKLVYLPQVEEIDPELTVLEAALQASAEDIDEDYIKEANAAIALGKIGFIDQEQKVKSLSGGWLKRLAIARQIARDPDVLLLDEPTNHLDVDGVEWLEDFLRKAPFSYIVITHDRLFLEKATNRIIELNDMFDGGMLSFNCAYNDFILRRQEYLDGEQARFESLSNKNRREQDWVKAGVKARGTKQNARVKEAGDLQQEVNKLRKQTNEQPRITIDFEKSDRKSKRLVVAHEISKNYGDKVIVKGLDLTLTPGDRYGLLGLNGVGKTTLMKMIAGEEQPDIGSVKATTGVKILHFDQARQLVSETESLKDALSLSGGDVVTYRGKEMHITSWARKLKFKADQLDTPIGSLSGGERARVIMGRLMLQTVDVLLLDEPTNDLDIPSIEVLEESLMDFPGAIMLVTHDREMLDRVSTVLLALDGTGDVTPYGSYAQWKKAKNGKNKEEKVVKTKAETPVQPTQKPDKLTYKEQQAWNNMEQNILEAEEALADLQNNPVAHDDMQNFMVYCEKLGEAQQLIENLYASWGELEMKVKAIKAFKA